MARQRESAFAATGTGSDEEVEVGEEFPAGIDSVNVGQAGRDGSKSAKDEQSASASESLSADTFCKKGGSWSLTLP